MDPTERYSRQRDIVPADRLATHACTVIGVGAIGRQVALQLTAVGVTRLQLIDFDTVEESNVATQGYFESDLGRSKVNATAELCRRINPLAEIEPMCERFRRSMDIGDAVFLCVDSIDARNHIWKAVKDRCLFFVDGRMSAETLRVLTVYDESSRQHYPTTLFSSEEAYQGACTAKATIYCANVAGGFMLAQFTKYLRQMVLDADVQINLLAGELSVNAPSA